MNIVKMAWHACARVDKMALPLLDHGHEVHLLASRLSVHHNLYTTYSVTEGMDQTVNAIKIYSKFADLFHVHNEPSWYVSVVKECCDVPVVIDVHDSYLSRVTDDEVDEVRAEGKEAFRITTEERNNFQLADGLVYPSKPFGDIVGKEFNLTQPSLVLPSYCYKKDYQYSCKEWLGGITYQGRVDLKKDIEKVEFLRGFRYCDYEEMAKELTKEDIAFHLYSVKSDKEFKEVYDDICIIHQGRSRDDLFPALSRHDWGLVGNIFPTPEWDVALPNKLFEYVASCVPIVAINARESARFIKEHDIGIEVESIQELKDRWSEHEKYRHNLIKKRQQFTMDVHIHQLEELYGKVLKL